MVGFVLILYHLVLAQGVAVLVTNRYCMGGVNTIDACSTDLIDVAVVCHPGNVTMAFVGGLPPSHLKLMLMV